MNATQPARYGVVRFVPLAAFEGQNLGLNAQDRVARLVEMYDSDSSAQPENTSDWPRIQHAIRRGEEFVIETTTPSFTARLRFSPTQPDTGDYEIRYRPRVRVEKGRTNKVTPILTENTDVRVSMLKPFTTRFVVSTIGAARPHSVLIWLFGLNNHHNADEAREETVE